MRISFVFVSLIAFATSSVSFAQTSAAPTVKSQTVAPNFFDPYADSLPPAKGIRPVLLWARTSPDRLLVTSKPGGEDKTEILKLIETLPPSQESLTSKLLNEIPESSRVNAVADKIRKIDGVKDVKMVVHFSRFTNEEKTPAQISIALITDCYADAKEVCGTDNERVILKETIGDFSITSEKVAAELERLEKYVGDNVRTIAANEKKNADEKKALEMKRAKLKAGIDKFPHGDKPTAPAKDGKKTN
ncbi:MAG: hypothetical protein JNL01_16015 [Bdellovibrionales bacterium]|nr:hypothetical protein [Bdellovibrionales bacterium]